MLIASLFALSAVSAAAHPAALSATLEALRSHAVADPSGGREAASSRSGRAFDGNLTVDSLEPVPVDAPSGRRTAPEPQRPAPKPPTPPSDGAGADYYFKGTTPFEGITIYQPVKGEGSTVAAPAPNYGKYGKMAMGGGAVLGAGALAAAALGAAPVAIPLAFLAGALFGAGAILSFIFGGKKT